MDMKDFQVSLVLGETPRKKREKKETEVLDIQVMLSSEGLYLSIGAKAANRIAFDRIVGQDWTVGFINEIGDVLERSRDMNALLLRRGREIAIGALNKMREEGRL